MHLRRILRLERYKPKTPQLPSTDRTSLMEDPAIRKLIGRVWTRHDDSAMVVIDGVQLWPMVEDSKSSRKVEGRDLLSTAPPEIIYKIANLLDDVGYVCLRNTHRRLRSVLSIDSLSIKPAQKYIM